MRKKTKQKPCIQKKPRQRGISITTARKIAKHRGEGKEVMEALLTKAIANSQKRTYTHDLIIPNNAMLLQLLKHRWQRYKEEVSGIYRFRSIQVKNDCYKEKLKVLSSGVFGNVFFEGLSVEDLFFISGIFTLYRNVDCTIEALDREKYAVMDCRALFKVLYPGRRYDKQSEAQLKHFTAALTSVLDKNDTMQADYYINDSCHIKTIDTDVKPKSPGEVKPGVIFHRARLVNGNKIYIQIFDGLLMQSVFQKRLVTISKDWLKFGTSASNHDITKFYIAYRVQLSTNTHNKMKAEISIKQMDAQIGKTDKAFVKKYLQYLKDIRALKDFTVSRVKISWTMQAQGEREIDLIQVRDEKKGLVKLPMPAKIKRLEKRLSAVNAFNGKRAVTLGKHRILNTRLHAVFSRGSFDMGGRLYTDGDNGFQGVKSEEREKILIDGKKTVELDFSAYHPHLIYALRGLQTNTDPYGFHPCRDAAKRAFNIMLNAKDRNAAIGAFKHEWGETISADHIFNLCREAHKAIADLFCSDSGITLQNIDSKIALEIVEAMQRRKAVCLPMHDSFIVAADRADELKQTMQEIYHRNTGGDCPIK